jgi:hypothetical protein
MAALQDKTALVAFLASDAARCITGASIPVDGGSKSAVSRIRFRPRHLPRLILLHRCLVRNYDGLRILLRDQQDFPRGTLFRCRVRLVRVFQCETLAKRDRQLPGPHGFSHVR